MRIAMGNSFMAVVSAEMVSADAGLGYLIFNARLWMATDQILIGIFFLGVLGIFPDWVFRILIKRRSEEHTSELQSLMRISYAVFCLKKTNNNQQDPTRQIIKQYA